MLTAAQLQDCVLLLTEDLQDGAKLARVVGRAGWVFRIGASKFGTSNDFEQRAPHPWP